MWKYQGKPNIHVQFSTTQIVYSPTIGKKRQNRTLSVIKPVAIKLETQSLESVDFTITTWKNELQDKLVETSYRLNETIVEKKH